MKKSPERFRKYLRLLSELISYEKTSRMLGDDPSSIFRWINESRAASATPDVPSVYQFEFEGREAWLHEHVRSAVTTSIELIEASARERALHGTWTETRFQGGAVYKRDPELIGRPWLADLLGLPDDLLRDDLGRPVPEVAWTPPSTDLVMGILAAHSKRYKKQSQLSIDMQARVGGVLVMGANKPNAPQLSAPAVPLIAEIVRENDDGEPARADDPPVSDDVVQDQEGIVDAPSEPEPKIQEPAPTPTPDPLLAPRKTVSPLVADLMARIKSAPGSPERMKPVQ